MNTRRIIFWAGFIIILGLVVWGLIVAMNKPINNLNGQAGTPAAVTSFDHVLGPENAPVTMIEYSDFECPACRSYSPVVKQLFNEASTTLRIVFRHYPLAGHRNAYPAAIASEAAAQQGKFWEMHDLLFDQSPEWVGQSDPTSVFVGFAEMLGLNTEKFRSDLASSSLKERVDRDMREGSQIGITYTPSFFVNGKLIENPGSYEEFKQIIDSANQNNTR